MKNIVNKSICLISPLFLTSCTFIGPTWEKLSDESKSPDFKNIMFTLIFGAWVLATAILAFTSFMDMLPWSEREHYEINNGKIYHRNAYSNEGGFSGFFSSFKDTASILMGLWFGLSSLLLLMYYVWYTFFGMKDYNMLIKTVSFIMTFIGYIWIYLKYWYQLELFFIILGVISFIVFFGDIAITLWNT